MSGESRLILGGLSFNGQSEDLVSRLLDQFRTAGGATVDTGTVYGKFHHEQLARYFQRNGRETFAIFDKVGHPRHGQIRVTRDDILADAEADLAALQVESVETIALHRDNPAVPVGEIVTWMNELISRGYTQVIGVSNWTVERLVEANEWASENGMVPFTVNSPGYSLAVPLEPFWSGCHTLTEAEAVWHAQTQFPLVVWSAGANGFFAGVESADITRTYGSETNALRKQRAEELGLPHGVSPTQIALAWLLHQPLDLRLVVGPRSEEQLADCLAAESLRLSIDELQYLVQPGSI